MRLKFKFLMLFISLLAVFGVTAGVSYFYFGQDVSANQTIENSGSGETEKDEVFSDNILENYEFGTKKNLNETYTYYFFPSTLYQEIAVNGQDPETAFGYNEVVLNDLGLPITNTNGDVEYDVKDSKEDDNTIVGVNKDGVNYTTYYDYLTNNLNYDMDYYLNSSVVYNITSKNVSYKKINPGYGYGWIDSVYYNNWYHVLRYPNLDNLKLNAFNDPYLINSVLLQDDDIFNEIKNNLNTIITYCVGSFNYTNNQIEWGLYDTDMFIHKGGIKYDSDYYDVFEINNEYLLKECITALIDEKIISTKDDFRYYFNEVYSPSSSEDNNKYRIDLDYSSTFSESSPYGSMSSALDADINNFIDNYQSGGQITKNVNYNTGYTKQYEEQFQNRRQFRNDRFGFWTDFYDLNDLNNLEYAKNNQGVGSRYLPIKITVNGNLSPDILSSILPNVLASMCDYYEYFDATSNCWTYNKYDNDGNIVKDSALYSTAIDGFTPKDITNIFDIMQSPENYDDDANVIRLYPVFSNGKNYFHDYSTPASEGGKDPVKAEFYYNSNSSESLDNLVTHKKLNYSSEVYKNWNGHYYNLNYMVLKNIYLEEGIYDSIAFASCFTSGMFGYSGQWYVDFKINSEQLKSFINTYGEGLYTFYFFVANAYTEISSPVNADDLNDIQTSVTDSNSAFTSLIGKNLINPFGSGSPFTSGMHTSEIGTSPYRGVALLAEKVTNLRLVTDIPITENGDTDWSDIDSDIESGLTTAKNFVIIGNQNVNTYEVSGSNNNTNHPDSPYVYLLQNADFRYVNNLYFQIRFSNKYISDAMRIVTDFNEYNTDSTLKENFEAPDKYASVNIGGEFVEFSSQRELVDVNEDVFIQNISVTGSGGKTRNGFKLRDYLARGVYDILLVSYGTIKVKDDQGNEHQVQLLNMYINRHKNSFIKVFDGYPGSFTIKGGDSTFVSHKQEGVDDLIENLEPDEDNNTAYANKDTHLIWEGQAYLGDLFSTNTPNDYDVSFINSLKTYFEAKSDGDYELIDTVTGKTMAYLTKEGTNIEFFNSKGSTKAGNVEILQVLKNYVLYFQPIPQTSTGA